MPSSTLDALRISFESVITNMKDLSAAGTTPARRCQRKAELVLAKNMRVHELAKKLGMTNAEMMALCDVMGVGVKTHSSTLSRHRPIGSNVAQFVTV